MRVSIVMPSLNQAAFIEQAITSVLAQDWPDLELVVMDGGSTDGTMKILEQSARRSGGRLRWWSEKDNGPAQALNKAITRAAGEFIGWLNADDVYEPQAIRRAVDALSAHPDWLMVYGKGRHIDASGQTLDEYPTKSPDAGLLGFADGCYICQPTVVVRKAFIDQIGLLNEELRTAFDLDWWLRVFSTSPERVGFLDSLQAQSRLHDTCITKCHRDTITIECMRLLSEQLGNCPIHWFETRAYELIASHDLTASTKDKLTQIRGLGEQIRGYLSSEDQVQLSKLVNDTLPRTLKRFVARQKTASRGFQPPRKPSFIVRRQLRDTAALIRASDLFDGLWYLEHYPDVAAAHIDPALHYLAQGADEGRNPSSRFDTNAYLLSNPDVLAYGVNPLVHFLCIGRNEDRTISPVSP